MILNLIGSYTESLPITGDIRIVDVPPFNLVRANHREPGQLCEFGNCEGNRLG